MYVAIVPNRNSPPAILLRESFRENGKVRNRTLSNISDWPPEKIEALRQVLKGNAGPPRAAAAEPLSDAFEIVRSLPHGHVAAVLGTIRRLGLDTMLDATPSDERQRVLALIANRIIDPGSKLAAARSLAAETRRSTLAEELGIENIDEDQLYDAMDWLLPRQPRLEQKLAKRHFSEGTLVLYDVSSTYFEGHTCPLAKFGHSRDERKNNLQIVFGVLCSSEGCPVAVEVFEGNTADPKTLSTQLTKLRERFQLNSLVLVTDRGLLTQKRIDAELRPLEGVDWITALRAPQIQKLVSGGSLQLSLFDQQDLIEITHPDYSGERLIVCRNPLLAEERKRKRAELIQAAEKKLKPIIDATKRARRPLRDEAKINYRIGKQLASVKVAKYFRWQLGDNGLEVERNQEHIDADAVLDGVYVIRTSVKKERSTAEQTVLAYKGLSDVERAFRSCKGVDLQIRPIHHRLADRVRAHVLICMLAYYVEWHMRQKLAPVLFHDEQPGHRDGSVVSPARRSPAAIAKADLKRTNDDMPVQSYRDCMKDLSTIVRNTVQPKRQAVPSFKVTTRPTPPQRRALQLLGISL